MFKLVIQDDEGKTTVVPLVRDEITIGRKEGNTIRLTERNVSRRHARILKTNDEVQIEDLGSYNGIRVNNAKIAAKASLRTTDQVQIGDYKLYLKNEVVGADANATVPIDRHHIAPTDVVPVVNPVVEPVLVTPPTAVAEAESVADAAVSPVVAKPGHGRLVVVSSNLAGKEFDLTRPQMVIGRTEDNDLVLHHRSISRNHAKISRDPETLHYTISDLQSANGVRVNDQDYAKVELRRGDLVDLGHVRLRFVDPGEDFVFARDAVISDVPEEGGRKGLVVAVVLAMMVLGAAAALLWFKTHDTAPAVAIQSNDAAAVAQPDSAGSAAVVQPASEDAAVAVVDATVTAVVDPAQEAARISAECSGYEKEAKWSDLTLCADKLAAVDAAAAGKFKAKVSLEIRANIQKDKMDTELAAGNLTKAKAHLAGIPNDSVAKKPAQAAFDQAEQRLVDDFKARAARAKRAGKCADIDVLANQANAQSSRAAAEVRAFKCEAAPPPLDCTISLRDINDKKCVKQFCGGHETDPRCGVAPPPCDADALLKTAEGSVALGLHKEALGYYEDALRCKADGHTVELAYMEACNAKIPAKAKQYWKKLSAERQNSVVQICTRNQIARDVLDAP